MRRFRVKREEDISGVSGIGVIAEGLEFEDGSVVMKWLSHKSTITFFSNIKHLKDLHGHGGNTKIIWIDPDPNEGSEENEEENPPAAG